MATMDKTEAGTRRAVKGGIIAGLVGGLVLTLFMLAMAAARGTDLWVTMKGSATPFLAERAAATGFDGPAVLLGLLCHYAISAGWGLLFGLIFYGLPRGTTVLAGLVWGLVVWIGMFYVVLPLVGLGSIPKMVPVGFAIFEHLLFGLSTALAFLPFQRTVRRGAPRFQRREPVAH